MSESPHPYLTRAGGICANPTTFGEAESARFSCVELLSVRFKTGGRAVAGARRRRGAPPF